MGHFIEGFIAKRDGLAKAAPPFANAVICPLEQGFGFLPLPDAEDDESDDGDGGAGPWVELFMRLSARLADWARDLSRQFPIAYIETEYFGGTGGQRAMAWAAGTIAHGPTAESTLKPSAGPPSQFVGPNPINHALRVLGVVRGKAHDEYDALGLGLHRSNEKWINAARSGS